MNLHRPKLIDLFCGAGGAGMGYHRAGFDVVGVDINPQPDYPFEFHQADAVTFPLDGFDAIHASPPCQAYTAMSTMWNARKDHPELVDVMRERLKSTGLPYVIENVPGAPMDNPVTLCGSSLGLGVEKYGRELRRHRLFETNFPLMVSPCAHQKATIGIYGDHARDRRRTEGSRGVDFPDAEKLELGREAMGMPWVTRQSAPRQPQEHRAHRALPHGRGQRATRGGRVSPSKTTRGVRCSCGWRGADWRAGKQHIVDAMRANEKAETPTTHEVTDERTRERCRSCRTSATWCAGRCAMPDSPVLLDWMCDCGWINNSTWTACEHCRKARRSA